MGREILGLIKCPECGLDGAQVKRQKNGLAYRFCPDCAAQYFPRDQAASDRLLSKISKADPVTVPEAAGKPDPVTVPAAAVKAANKTAYKPASKPAFNLGGL
jgi:hypothetical protein